MFLGSHTITMDSKGRLAIPAKIRDALMSACDGRLVITAHTEERCLLVYPEPQWLDLLPKIEAASQYSPQSSAGAAPIVGLRNTSRNGRQWACTSVSAIT